MRRVTYANMEQLKKLNKTKLHFKKQVKSAKTAANGLK